LARFAVANPLTAASLLLTAAASAIAQTAPQVPTLQVHSRIVQIPTLVQTTSKELIHSLSATDFQVTDDGAAQTVTVEEEAARPLSLVVLMQTGGIAPHLFAQYSHLGTMLASLLGEPASDAPPNQVAIVSFDSKPEGATPFTSDVTQWADAINQPEAGNHGAAILDGLAYALHLLQSQPPGNRRAIILLSGPRDEGSRTSLKEILRTAGETDTAVYALTFSPEKTEFKNDFTESQHLNPPLPGVGQAYFDLSDPLRLIIGATRKNATAELATLTGGEAAGFDNEHELADDLNTLNNHLRNRYVLSFTPTSNRPGLHMLQVRLPGRPDLIVSARTIYWLAEPQ
jgi:VWFA-related protein